jgi:hypothetical protein
MCRRESRQLWIGCFWQRIPRPQTLDSVPSKLGARSCDRESVTLLHLRTLTLLTQCTAGGASATVSPRCRVALAGLRCPNHSWQLLAWRAHAVEFLFGILDHLWLVEVERWCRLTRAAMFCPLGGGQMVKHKWLLFSYYTILLVFGVNINLLASCTTFRQSYPLNLILKYSLSFTVRDFFYSTGFRNCSRSSSSKFILYIN